MLHFSRSSGQPSFPVRRKRTDVARRKRTDVARPNTCPVRQCAHATLWRKMLWGSVFGGSDSVDRHHCTSVSWVCDEMRMHCVNERAQVMQTCSWGCTEPSPCFVTSYISWSTISIPPNLIRRLCGVFKKPMHPPPHPTTTTTCSENDLAPRHTLTVLCPTRLFQYSGLLVYCAAE
jgi:hypothetical protein